MVQNQFGRYQIKEKLGMGGMSVVYRALDTESDRDVALKILHIHMADDDNLVRRFRREAQIAKHLQHPHIIRIYDYGEVKQRPYITMQFMTGGSLAQLFARPVKIKLDGAVQLLKIIGSALDYAHQQGVVHRDLKLENILLDEHYQPILSDFGIAHLSEATRLTSTGQRFGTPLYMSPEQARGVRALDYRSDLYSLAVMTYLMATGYFPFSGGDSLVILNQHLNMYPPLPTQLNPQLPPEVNRVLLRGLGKNPEDRYESATAFVDAFAEATTNAALTKTLILSSHPTPFLPEDGATPYLNMNMPEGANTLTVGTFSGAKETGIPAEQPSIPEKQSHRRRLLVMLLLILGIIGMGALVASQGAGPSGNLLTETPPSQNALAGNDQTITVSATANPGHLPVASTIPVSPVGPGVASSAAPAVSNTPTHTPTVIRTRTPNPATTTPSRVPPTSTRVPATNTPLPPTATYVPSTNTPVPPTSVPPTSVPPTSVPPTSAPPTNPPPPAPTDPPPQPTNPPLLPLPTLPIPLPTLPLGLPGL